ncbi:MAG: glycoside hydrolase family 88 protein [Planctomycetes bacterium]|nr:glycoside hydrolase family 88 protein [Planctomycetota bacterium]
MIDIDFQIEGPQLERAIARMWELSAAKIAAIEAAFADGGTPVFTVQGRYRPQGWTEWTQGFQFGSALLQFDATGDERFLEIGRNGTRRHMPPHVTHFGVHDHGFNNVSTYGNLRRLMLDGRIPHDEHELELYELALKASGAVQAMRWTRTSDGGGFIYSFNGPHSLFADTIRSLRSLALAHRLGHRVLAENDEPVSLLGRLIQYARATARYNVYYGEGRDAYDIRGRVAHESLFNTNDGRYRCPSTQQGYSPFSTWTRGLAWIMLGYAEQLEFLETLADDELEPHGGRGPVEQTMLDAARATCDFYIEHTPADGVPYWDTGAPGLVHLGDWRSQPADPFNDHEPVDTSAAAIAAQGLVRLGHLLEARDESEAGRRYRQAGLTVLRTLLDEPYLSTADDHHGLLLHAIYHRPRGWDHVPDGSRIPRGESCLWGDYHLREAALYASRMDRGPYYTFYGQADQPRQGRNSRAQGNALGKRGPKP